MATDILKLKKDAIAKGMDKNEARSATRASLESFLGLKAPRKKAPVKKTTAKATPARSTRSTAKKAAPARKISTRKPAGTAQKSAQAKAPAKSVRKTGAAKRPASNNGNGSGRHTIDALDFTNTEGWNPRVGSAVEVIWKALKRAKGDVGKAFDILLPDIADFVGAKKQDGTKRSKADRENMLRYRISRTKFDFAVRTGQHEIATERVEYGTGDYATTRAKKPARAAAKTSRTTKRTTTKAAARPATRRTTTKRTPAKKTTRR